jgi:phytoene synthase
MDHLVEEAKSIIERGSKSFAGAARLFDSQTRSSAYMLYAWCRHCDDEIDGQELGFSTVALSTEEVRRRLLRLEARTLAAVRGNPDDDPVFQGLARVTAQHNIPERHPMELIEGFRMDVDGRRYARIEDTLEYCYHVAGVVGVMMAMVMGVRDRETLNRASDLGLAFQLTNIARDVIPDAEAGRLYLPELWLADIGVAPHEVADPAKRAAVAEVTARVLEEAERYYISARYGLARLPLRSAWAVAAARKVYRDIGALVKSRGEAAWAQRAVVSRQRKLAGLAWGGLSVGRASLVCAIAGAPARTGLWTHPGLAVH